MNTLLGQVITKRRKVTLLEDSHGISIVDKMDHLEGWFQLLEKYQTDFDAKLNVLSHELTSNPSTTTLNPNLIFH